MPTPSGDVVVEKEAVRQRIWKLLREHGISPTGRTWQRSPNFEGSTQAAQKLAEQPFWRQAQVAAISPDGARLPVRVIALHEGKIVYMPVPKLHRLQAYYHLDPEQLVLRLVQFEELAKSGQVPRYTLAVDLEDMTPVDLIVCGSVAVNAEGVRVGDGNGYADIELGLLSQFGLISESTTIVTTVHRLQVVEEELPRAGHDFTVDYVVTPEEVITCANPYRPHGLIWETLRPEQISSKPLLKVLARDRQT